MSRPCGVLCALAAWPRPCTPAHLAVPPAPLCRSLPAVCGPAPSKRPGGVCPLLCDPASSLAALPGLPGALGGSCKRLMSLRQVHRGRVGTRGGSGWAHNKLQQRRAHQLRFWPAADGRPMQMLLLWFASQPRRHVARNGKHVAAIHFWIDGSMREILEGRRACLEGHSDLPVMCCWQAVADSDCVLLAPSGRFPSAWCGLR